MFKILYEDNHLLVVDKPINIGVMEDESKDLDLLSMIKSYLKEKYNKPGEAYVGLVHRLDRPVGGVMVFAKTSKAASRLSDQIRLHRLDKKYLAISEQKIKPQCFKDYLVKNNKTNTSYVTTKDQNGAKLAELTIVNTQSNAQFTLYEIALKTGRSHQIRVQMSHHGAPLWGDQRYNKKAQSQQQIALFAYSLSFDHPTTKERLTFKATPQSYPFDQFKLQY